MQIHPLPYHSWVLNCPLDFAQALSRNQSKRFCLFILHQFAITSFITRHERAFALCICSVSVHISVLCVLKIGNLKQSGCLQHAKSYIKKEACKTSLVPSPWYSIWDTEGYLRSYFLERTWLFYCMGEMQEPYAKVVSNCRYSLEMMNDHVNFCSHLYYKFPFSKNMSHLNNAANQKMQLFASSPHSLTFTISN